MKLSRLIVALVATLFLARDYSPDPDRRQQESRAPAWPAGWLRAHSPWRPVHARGLVGLYRSGDPARPNRACIVRKGAELQFGIVIWGRGAASCSGSGTVGGEPAALELRMAGDSPCTVPASMRAGRLTLSRTVPRGCAYYCAPNVGLAGASFERVAAGSTNAMKATDLAGEPLCAGG